MFADSDYPARPYPGARPGCSFVHDNRVGREVVSEGDGWRVEDGRRLDLGGRVPILAYGSNACPSKITWLRENLGLEGEVIVVRAAVDGLAAVWAAGHRIVDEQRPATLAALPGREQHAVWFATEQQREVLDRCEGRGERYDLAHVRTGRVTLENGAALTDPLAYLGLAGIRMPLLVGGAPVRCADVPQREALALVGVPAASDGIDRYLR